MLTAQISRGPVYHTNRPVSVNGPDSVVLFGNWLLIIGYWKFLSNVEYRKLNYEIVFKSPLPELRTAGWLNPSFEFYLC